MRDLQDIREQVHHEAKLLRNIDHLLKSTNFENLWHLSTDHEKDKLRMAVHNRSKENITHWYKTHPLVELGEQTFSQLKERAKDLCVPDYSRKTKVELLLALKHSKKEIPISQPVDNSGMILEIKKLTSKIKTLFLEAGIGENYFTFPDDAKHFDGKVLEEALKWTKELFIKEYKDVQTIKSLLTEEMWTRYMAWEDFSDHREVVLLNEALKKLRKKVVNGQRPDLFKRERVKVFLNRLKKEK
jgi:hypothetical protein